MAKASSAAAIDDLPRPHARRISPSSRLLLRQQWRLDHAESVFPGIVAPRCISYRVRLQYRIGGAVTCHIEPHVKDVLVNMANDAGRDQRAATNRPVLQQARSVDDTGQFDVEFNGAVEVEMPVEGVLVVAHVGNE